MFEPRGLAVFGAVNSPGSFGQMNLMSQVRYGYRGRLYPVSPKGGELNGMKIYKSLEEIDGPVDLASISVPAAAVPDVLKACLARGVAGAQILTSGFAELDDEQGRSLQEEIIRISRQGLRIVGPNCFGLHSPKGGITLIPGSSFSRERGGVAFISQSGGVAADFGFEVMMAGLGISKIASFGNGVDLGAVELMEYLADDPDTEIIAAYLEGVRDGQRFIETVRRTTARKPVVIWKGGLTPLGGQAARSHTGSLGGEAQVWEGALSQAGAVMVQGLDEITDTLRGLAYLKRKGGRIALMGGGGAIGVFSCDLAYRYGLDMPIFSPETQAELQKSFPTPGNSVRNPLDTGTPILPLEKVRVLAEQVLTREPIDILVLILLIRPLEVEIRTFMEFAGLEPPPRGAYLESLLEVLAPLKKSSGKDMVMVFDNRAYRPEDAEAEGMVREMRNRYQSEGIPVFPSAERALRGIRNALRAWR
ncbi:MAG: CoA-binding protein [Proteobacteria bacterium]|nr:CoA-binding protein [Pseudomonadota bacterium]